MSTITSFLTGSDNQSGYFKIPDFQIAIISENKQMVVIGDLTIEGALQIDGQLILEP